MLTQPSSGCAIGTGAECRGLQNVPKFKKFQMSGGDVTTQIPANDGKCVPPVLLPVPAICMRVCVLHHFWHAGGITMTVLTQYNGFVSMKKPWSQAAGIMLVTVTTCVGLQWSTRLAASAAPAR